MKKLLLALGLLAPIAADAQPVVPPIGTAALVCAYNASAPSLNSGQFAYVQCDANGNILTNQNFPGSAGLGVGAWGVSVIAAGAGYAPGDTYTPSFANATQNSILGGGYNGAVLYVSQTQVVSATVASGGSGCSNGTQTLTGTTGTGTKFQAAVSVSGGVVSVVNSISVAGTYTVNPTSPDTMSGGGCGVSPTLNVVMGVAFANVQNPGSYSRVPQNPATATQSATSGSGTGATFSVTFAAQAAYVVPPINSNTGAVNENQFQGYLSGNSITTGVQNTGYGWSALSLTTTGQFNAAFGTGALWNNVSGSNNNSFGTDSMRNTLTVGNTVAMGTAAMRNPTGTAGFIVAIGTQALQGQATSTGQNMIAIGYQAALGASWTTANQDVFVGNLSGNTITIGSGSSCFGHAACQNITTAGALVAVGGFAAGGATATGNNNTVGGYQSAFHLTSSPSNAFWGYQSGFNISAGNGQNSCFGYTSCLALTTGQQNTLIGAGVGSVTLQTGQQNLLLGTANNCDTPANNTNNLFGICASSGSTYLMSGSVASGSLSLTINTAGTFNITGILSSTAAQTGYLCWTTTSGLVTFDPSNTCLVSSARFKEDIRPLEGSLAKVLGMRPVSFHYRDRAANPDLHVGFLAENVAEVDPRFVIYDDQGLPLKLRLQEMPALTFGAIQELEKRLEAVENRLR